MLFTEICFAGDDGCELRAWVSPPCPEIDNPTPIVLLHGGGPDHRMFLPLAESMPGDFTVILPDIRGYGRSLCRDASCHRWSQYASDVIAMLDALGIARAIIGGAGLGGTIALRVAVEHPGHVLAVVVIGLEDIEDDEAKQVEIRLMDEFAERARRDGIAAAWEPLFPHLSPVIGTLVRDAIPRSDPASIAAAAAIGRDRSFISPHELAAIAVPTLLFPGADARHPEELAKAVAKIIPKAEAAGISMSGQLETSDDFARAFGPEITGFARKIRNEIDG
ncbi:MAG TPA: alpha/beta hydrolase [Sphingopyxis sp.]|nr:alpha/beta hydrolase [Sphingopyxis sp.]